MRLSSKNLASIKAAVSEKKNISLPAYNRDNTDIGIVHLGPGAFHRAHQVAYTESVLNQFGGNWGICAVSMRSTGARDILEPQDGLYTLAILDQKIEYQVIGAIKEVLVATDQLPQVLARMASEQVKIVSLTVTEKGYCLNTQGQLDLKHADIQHDLNNLETPRSAVGLLVQALKLRMQNNVAAFNVISCDNLPSNGHKLKNAVLTFAKQQSVELANWIEQSVSFPSTMVDSITPKTDDNVIKQVSEALGADDQWPIQREAFLQWVIEDTLTGDRPAWEKAGVVFSNNIDAFENAKLRILNGLHSTLAYMGLLIGLNSVKDAISNQALYNHCQRLLNEEIIPSFIPPAELDVNEYASDIIRRFENPQIVHLLSQIAWDGSQKIPVRILGTLTDNLRAGSSIKLLTLTVAAWIHFIRLTGKNNGELTDPLATELLQLTNDFNGDAAHDVNLFVSSDLIFTDELKSSELFCNTLIECYEQLADVEQKGLAVLGITA